ncbi:MAG TPA: GlsB/YeaQ/YmgE family stress response membrane protein [Candidatus Methylomirabilis sp.]|nr:GlsB/YeaQ/YmgE family stress response membrane protein [Candidatus Methylomirabilis sp.]
MNLGLFAMWVVVGLVVGWLAGYVLESGGYGLRGDLILGLVGSVAGSVIFRGLEISPDAGLFVLGVVAFIGAAIMIFVQRKIWYVPT